MRLPLIIFQIWMWGVPIWGLCALAYLLFTVLRDASKFKKEQAADSAKKNSHTPARAARLFCELHGPARTSQGSRMRVL